jgi:hypothetical protein
VGYNTGYVIIFVLFDWIKIVSVIKSTVIGWKLNFVTQKMMHETDGDSFGVSLYVG